MTCVFETDEDKLFRKTTRENNKENFYPLKPEVVSELLSLFAPIRSLCSSLRKDPDSVTLEQVEKAAKSMDGSVGNKLKPRLFNFIDSNQLPEFQTARIVSEAISLWKAGDLQGLKDLQKYINGVDFLGFWEHAALSDVISEYRYLLGEEKPKGFLG